jgi:hypothetical protein
MPLYLPPSADEYGKYEQGLLGGSAPYTGFPRTNMTKAASGGDLAALATGVMTGSYVWLYAGQVVNRIAVVTGATAGATLTHEWAAIYAVGGGSLGAQSTDSVVASVAANTLLEYVMSAAYTAPQDGMYPVAIMFAGTTVPSLRGSTEGTGSIAGPALTGFTTLKHGWTSGSALTTTAPASITPVVKVTVPQFWVY